MATTTFKQHNFSPPSPAFIIDKWVSMLLNKASLCLSLFGSALAQQNALKPGFWCMLAANISAELHSADSSAAMQLFTVRAPQSHRSVMYGGSTTEQEKERDLFTGCACLKILIFLSRSGFRSKRPCVMLESNFTIISRTVINLLILLQKNDIGWNTQVDFATKIQTAKHF